MTNLETKSLLALSIVASIAAIFLIPAGLASADHETTDESILSKSTDCPAELNVAPTVPTTCNFTITYNNVSATILDTVPAEWEVTNSTEAELAGCSIDPANKGNKANKSATKIECPDVENLDVTIEITTRASPGKGHDPTVFKPTSCGILEINDGAHAVNATSGEVLFSTEALTITVTDPEDLDCDGLTNDEEIELGTDPNNPDSDGDGINDGDEVAAGTNPNSDDTDSDGVLDGVDQCPLDGDMGFGVDADGCPNPAP